MTLYDFLIIHAGTQAKRSMDNIQYDKEFYKGLGGVEMCNKLINILSDDTLKMEVTMRHDALKKGE